MTVADKVREAKPTDYREIADEMKLHYVHDDGDRLHVLYRAFLEREARLADVQLTDLGKIDPAVQKSIKRQMDWYAQVADAMLRLGSDNLDPHHLKHSRILTGPVCDFFRTTMCYEPDF